MVNFAHKITCVAALAAMLTACQADKPAGQEPFKPEYLGVKTRLLDGDLVNFFVAMRGARNNDDVVQYTRCAAAQYALIRGYGFARHLRTQVDKRAGVWHADAVFIISAALPRGVETIDAEVTVASCVENHIPRI